MSAAREKLKSARRIVIKVGTSTLTYGEGKLNLYRIEHLIREITDLHNAGKEIIFVTSGAIAAGIDKKARYNSRKSSTRRDWSRRPYAYL